MLFKRTVYFMANTKQNEDEVLGLLKHAYRVGKHGDKYLGSVVSDWRSFQLELYDYGRR